MRRHPSRRTLRGCARQSRRDGFDCGLKPAGSRADNVGLYSGEVERVTASMGGTNVGLLRRSALDTVRPGPEVYCLTFTALARPGLLTGTQHAERGPSGALSRILKSARRGTYISRNKMPLCRTRALARDGGPTTGVYPAAAGGRLPSPNPSANPAGRNGSVEMFFHTTIVRRRSHSTACAGRTVASRAIPREDEEERFD